LPVTAGATFTAAAGADVDGAGAGVFAAIGSGVLLHPVRRSAATARNMIGFMGRD
jgi:hypothetical protein